MAGPYYVDSNATGGTDTGGSYTNAFLTLAQAITAHAAGEIIYVAHNHTETFTTSQNFTLKSGAQLIVTNSTSEVLSEMDGTTGYFSMTSGNVVSLQNATASGNAYYYGIWVKYSGTSSGSIRIASSVAKEKVTLEKCTLSVASGGSRQIYFGAADRNLQSTIELLECDLEYGGNTAQELRLYSSSVSMAGGSIVCTGTQGTNMLSVQNYVGGGATFDAVDMSTVTGNLVDMQTSRPVRMTNCKVNTSATRYAGVSSNHGGELLLINCEDGDNNYVFEHYLPEGSTIAVVDGGGANPYATDSGAAKYDGTTGFSWAIASTTYANFYAPYRSPWFGIYYDSSLGVTSITPAIEALKDAATAYEDDDVWIEVEAMTTSGAPLGVLYSGRMAVKGTPNGGWGTGIGIANWANEAGTAVSMKLTTASFTPQEIGYLRARVCVGLASVSDLYVDPTFRYA